MLAHPKMVRGTKEFFEPLSILQRQRGQDPHDQKLEMPIKQIHNMFICQGYILKIYQHICSEVI